MLRWLLLLCLRFSRLFWSDGAREARARGSPQAQDAAGQVSAAADVFIQESHPRHGHNAIEVAEDAAGNVRYQPTCISVINESWCVVVWLWARANGLRV